MSQAPTRHSRRLNGEAPSPVRPLPQRSRTPHYRRRSDELNSVPQVVDEVDNNMEVVVEHSEAGDSVPSRGPAIHHFMNAPGLDFLENALPSSPSYPLAPISTNPSPAEANDFHNIIYRPPTLHSPRSPNALDLSQTHDESASDSNLDHLFPPVQPKSRSPSSRMSQGCANVSAALLLHLLFLPLSAGLRQRFQLRLAVYLGLPSENPAQCGFLEPRLCRFFGSISEGSHPRTCDGKWHSSRDVEKDLSAAGSYRYASKHLLRKGVFALHLDSSMTVIAPRAAHTPTSHEIFRIRGIAEATFFFVLYVFPRYLTAPTVPPSSSSATPVPSENSRPASRSMSRTPMPQPPQIVQRCLANLALVSAALDQHFLPEAYQLSILLEDDGSLPKFGTAYTQIRQILIVEDRMQFRFGLLETVHLRKQQNVHPGCPRYAMYLQDRQSSNTGPASSVEQLKENALRRFLAVCFAPALATSHTAQSLNQAGGSGDCDYDQGKGQGGERQANPI
ncbi:hypothetical protein R3P38DRAFT_3297947 [Favolaschia claudopus]|uniref:Uncharacterized protein n=1 Tax=Favolaschia claudopus TaxID=2862362 RepID=A0AAV9Z5A0_9AGAR